MISISDISIRYVFEEREHKSKGPLMEDDLKILKVEYLNRLLDSTQILNLDLSDQSKYFEWRRPPMEDDVKILKVDYLSNYLLDPTQILNLS